MRLHQSRSGTSPDGPCLDRIGEYSEILWLMVLITRPLSSVRPQVTQNLYKPIAVVGTNTAFRPDPSRSMSLFCRKSIV
jgi:hypothetical protein